MGGASFLRIGAPRRPRLGVGSSGVANLCWNFATHRLNNVVVLTVFFMMTLVATALLEWAWLGVRPTPLLTVGAVLILYAAWSSRRLR